MSDTNNLCVPILERLRKLQQNQQQSKLMYYNYMLNVKCSRSLVDQCFKCDDDVIKTPPDVLCDKELQLNDDVFNIHIGVSNLALHEHGHSKSKSNKFLGELPGSSIENISHELFKPSEIVGDFNECGSIMDEKTSVAFQNKETKLSRPFLRKGEGISRFNMKIFKGFKKNGHCVKDNLNHKKKTLKEISSGKSKPLELKNSPAQVKKTSPFEQLEELVNHDSFCSTSSKVNKLLLDDSALSSTPISSKTSLNFTNVEFTPINRVRSPSRIKSTLELHSSIEIERNDVANKGRESFLGISGDVSSDTNTPTGILRNTTPIRNGPVLYNVKFRERGVEVLEYEDSVSKPKSSSSTLCEDDSDVISVSDLEHLALMNCKERMYQNIFSRSTYKNPDPTYKNDVIHGQSKRIPFSKSNAHDQRQPLLPLNTDAEAQKYLLLSKVNDLTKEINIFKEKNHDMDKIIEELKKEKENLIKEQKSVGNSNPIKNEPGIARKIYKDSIKLKSLKEKLTKLETENENLKNNIVKLEKREKEIKSYRVGMTNNKKNVDFNLEKKFIDRAKENNKVADNCVQYKKIIPKQSKGIKSFKRKVSSLIKNSENDEAKLSSPNLHEDDPDPHEHMDRVSENELMNQGTESYNKYLSDYTSAQKTPVNDLNESSRVDKYEKLNMPVYSRKSGEFQHNKVSPFEFSLVSRKVDPFWLSQKPVIPSLDESSAISIEIIDIPDKKNKIKYQNEEGFNVKLPISVDYQSGNKKVITESKVTYHYAKDKVTRTIYTEDEREEITFANGQKEIYFKDGSYQIFLANGASKSVYADGTEVCVCENGTVVRTTKSGSKTIHFPNGQKEVHEEGTIRRIYPDGTVKTLLEDGVLETRYANGLVRLKDKEGNVTCYKQK